LKEFETVNKVELEPAQNDSRLSQILTEHKEQGEEDQALEKRVEGKKAAAKKRATRRSKSL
jgi:condensin complex subunit 1